MSCEVLVGLHRDQLNPCGMASVARARSPDGREWCMCARHRADYKDWPRPGYLTFTETPDGTLQAT